MKQNKFSEMIFSESDACELIMQGHLAALDRMIVDSTVDLSKLLDVVESVPSLQTAQDYSCTVDEFHDQQQANWHMPSEYKTLDIAEYVLSLCQTQDELQRVGDELLLFQEHGLFDLLRYLKYLVDTMRANQVIWGVGRGSSVASYVLYKLGVHRINSMYYNLDPKEFLR
jgi:DNA polymerase III alpha subunit